MPVVALTKLRLLAVLLAVALAAACTRPTRVEGEWAPGAARDQSFHRYLVIGVSPAYTVRCRFERMMRASLQELGAEAVASCEHMTSKDHLSRDAVVELVGKIGVDAVLATRLVDARAGLEQGGTDEARGEAYVKPVGYGYDYWYGPYGVPVTYVEFVAEQPALTLSRSVVISSNLYETRGAALVYSLDTVTYDKDSQGAVIDSLSAAIAGRLQRDGLVR